MLYQAVRHAANQAQLVPQETAFCLFRVYDLSPLRSTRLREDYAHEVKRKELTASCYLARYCELERQYFTEKGVLRNEE